MTEPEDPYREPALYDVEYTGMYEDVAYYVQLARRSRGPVLELGCGNGRITIPIARSGVEIHGIDKSSAMLADMEEKLRSEPVSVRLRVRCGPGDFRRIEGDTRFPLIILPFNALHHCEGVADIEAVLAGVRARLAPGGTFALDCYLPDPILYARDPNRRYEERTFVDPRTAATLYSWEQGYWDSATRIHHVRYVYESEDGRQEEVHLRLHMYEREELRAIFARCGFQTTWEGGDFDGAPLRAGSLKWVMQLRPRD